MPRKCSVCIHSEYQNIDEALIGGEPLRDISRRFNIDKSALSRHKLNHLSALLVKTEEGKELAKAESLVDEIQRLRLEAARIYQKAEERGDFRTALAGVRELTRIVELLAKLQGDLNEQSVNIVFNARWIELRSVILNTLEEFPEAKKKLSEALTNAI
jgi:hypothetical protein